MDVEMNTSGGEKPVTVRKESPTTAPSNKTQTTKPQITKSQSAKPQKSQSTQLNNTANSKNTKSGVKINNTTPVSSSVNLTNTTLSSALNTNSNTGSNNTNSNQTLNQQIQNFIKTVTLQNASVLNGNNQLVMMSGNNQMILLPNQGTHTFQNIQLLNSDGNNKNGQQSVYFNGQSINLSNANLSSATGNGTAQKIMLQPHQSYSIVGNATPITTTQANLIQGTETQNGQVSSSVQSGNIQIGGSGNNFGSKNSGIQSGSIHGTTIQGASIQSIQGTNIQDLLKQLGGNGAQTINLTSVGSTQSFGNQTVNLGGNQYVLLNNIGNQNNINLNSSNLNTQQSVSSNNSTLMNNNQTGNSSSSGKMNSNKKSSSSSKPSIIRRNQGNTGSGGKKREQKVVLTPEQMTKFLEQTNTGNVYMMSKDNSGFSQIIVQNSGAGKSGTTRSMKPTNVQTSPGGSSNTKKQNSDAILKNGTSFPQIRKPTLTLAEVTKQISDQKQAKLKMNTQTHQVITHNLISGSNLISNLNSQNSQVSGQTGSIQITLQNSPSIQLSQNSQCSSQNSTACLNTSQLLQQNSPTSSPAAQTTKKPQSRQNKRKQMIRPANVQTGIKQEKIELSNVQATINQQNPAKFVVGLNQLISVDGKRVSADQLTGGTMQKSVQKSRLKSDLENLTADSQNKNFSLQISNNGSQTLVLNSNNQHKNTNSHKSSIQTKSSPQTSTFKTTNLQVNQHSPTPQNFKNSRVRQNSSSSLQNLNSPGNNNTPGSPNILVTQTNANGIVQQMMSVSNMSEMTSIVEKMKKDSPPKEGANMQINPRLLEQARRLPTGFKRDSDGKVHFSEGKNYGKKTYIAPQVKTNKNTSFQEKSNNKVLKTRPGAKLAKSSQLSGSMQVSAQLVSPIKQNQITLLNSVQLQGSLMKVDQNSQIMIKDGYKSTKTDPSRKPHKFTKMEPKHLNHVHSQNSNQTSTKTNAKLVRTRNVKQENKNSAVSNSAVDSTLNFLSKPETPTSSPGEVDYSSPHVLFSNQPNLNMKTRKDKSDFHSIPSKKMKMSIFRARTDLKVKTRNSSSLRTNRLEHEINTNSIILDNGVKRVNLVRQLIVNNCNNLHLTYNRLRRIRELLSTKSPVQMSISNQLVEDVTEMREESLEGKCGLSIATLPVNKVKKLKTEKLKSETMKNEGGEAQECSKMSTLFPKVLPKYQHRDLFDCLGIIKTVKTTKTSKTEEKPNSPVVPVVQPLRSARLAQKRTLKEEKENNRDENEETKKPVIPVIILPDPPLELAKLFEGTEKLNAESKRIFEQDADSEHLIDTIDVLMIRYKEACDTLMEAAGNVEFQGSVKLAGKKNFGSFVNCKKGTERKTRWSLDNSNKTPNYDSILCKSVVQRLQRENLACVGKMVALSREAIAVDRFVHQDELLAASNNAMLYGGIYGGRFSERRQSSLAFKHDENNSGGVHNKTSFKAPHNNSSDITSGKSSKNNFVPSRKLKKSKANAQ